MVVYDTSKQNKTINIYIQNRTYMTSGWQKMKIFKRIVIFLDQFPWFTWETKLKSISNWSPFQ